MSETTYTTPLQNAIIATSSIGSLLSSYNPNDTNKNIKQVRRDTKKLMMSRSKTNPKEFKEAIAIADKAWRDTINHFCEVEEKMEIEALYATMTVFNLYEAPLKRFANITNKKIENIMFNTDTTYKHQVNSEKAMNYYLDLLAESTGVHRRKSAIAGRAITIKNNLIIEGKIK
mgnify:CR=1 FL=1